MAFGASCRESLTEATEAESTTDARLSGGALQHFGSFGPPEIPTRHGHKSRTIPGCLDEIPYRPSLADCAT